MTNCSSSPVPRIELPRTPLRVSALCLGCGPVGTVLLDEALDRFVARFLAAGGNFFDTAHCYGFWQEGGNGASERALGDCLRRLGALENVVIGTKGGHPAAPPAYPRPDGYLAPDVLRQDIADSLERLRIPCIDLYWLHRDDPRVPVGEIIELLNEEITAGRLRALGGSNWSTARLAAANVYAAAHGLQGFAASQPQWNLAVPNWQPTADPTMRFLQPADIRWHAATQTAVVAYSPTANGYFATNGQRGAESFDNPTSRARLQRATALAADMGATTNQIALAYLRSHPFPVVPILGTTDPVHLDDACGAVTLTLTADQVQWLENGDAVHSPA